MDDFIRKVIIVSIDMWMKLEEILTCGDTENRNEGNANPFRGDIIVLELFLVTVGAVRGALRSFEVFLSQGSPGRRGRKIRTHDLGRERVQSWGCLGRFPLSSEGAFIPCH